MSISEYFRYRNDVFQSDIFVSDIGITDVDVGYRISPTLRSMSMPTYARKYSGIGRRLLRVAELRKSNFEGPKSQFHNFF
jgi:hypothetical protein